MMNISEKHFFAWIAAPLIAGLKGKSSEKIEKWLNKSKLPPNRLAGLAQRAHILSISVLRASLGDYPTPPGFPRDLPQRFRQRVVKPFEKKHKLDKPMLQKYLAYWQSECQTLHSKGALINFFSLPPQEIIAVLTGQNHDINETGLSHYFRKKVIDLLGVNSSLPFLLTENNLLLHGMASLFSDGLERCGVGYMCCSISNELSETVNSHIWNYRHLLGADQAEAPTIPRLSHIETKRLKKMMGEQQSEMEIASLILPDSQIMPAVTAALEQKPDEEKEKASDEAEPKTKKQIIETIGRYKILKIIGAGGMGAVYQGRDPETKQIIAIKLMHQSEDASPIDLMRFKQEARFAAKLNHPHIVKVYDADIDGAFPYLVMEYVQGTSLSKSIGKEKFSLTRSLEIIRDISRGLSYAHQRGIIHRDIKPSNIMLTEDGVPLLMDFGLAKNILSKDPQITKTGEILGTPQYMSPEQARGKVRELDGRSDIYSLGAVFYELLTGTPPIKGRTAVDILYHVVHSDPIAPKKLKARIPVEVESICLKAMEKKRQLRYQKADEMATDIENYLCGISTIASRSHNSVQRMRRWIRANLKTIVPVTLAFLSVVCCVATVLFFVLRSKNLSSEQQQKYVERALTLLKHGKVSEALVLLKPLARSGREHNGYRDMQQALADDKTREFYMALQRWRESTTFDYLIALTDSKDNLQKSAILLQLGLPVPANRFLEKVPAEQRMEAWFYFVEGQVLFAFGQEQAAAACMRKAAIRSRIFEEGQDPLLLYGLQRWAQAFYYSQRTLKKSARQLTVLMAQGLLYQRLAKFNQASRIWRDMEQNWPQMPGVYLYQSRCYGIPDYQRLAYQALEKLALQQGQAPDRAPITVSLAYVAACKLLAALPQEEHSVSRLALAALKCLASKVDSSGENRAKVLVAQAECYLLANKIEPAYRQAQEAFEIDSTEVDTCLVLLRCLYQKQRYEDAMNIGIRGLQQQPHNPDLRLWMAKIYRQCQQPQAAYCNFMRCYWLVKDRPSYHDIWRQHFANIDQIRKQYFDSWRRYSPMVYSRNRWQRYYYQLNTPDWDYDPDFFSVLLTQSKKLARSGKAAAAIALLRKLDYYHPCPVPQVKGQIYQKLASLYTAEGREQEAIDCYRLASRMQADSVQIYRNLAKYYLDKFQKSKQKKSAQAAVANMEFTLLLAADNVEEAKQLGKTIQQLENE